MCNELLFLLLFFFFSSSRRRHTRCLSDWSSDVCSSDLIFVAGHGGLAGSAIVRELRAQGYANLILRSQAELDLTRSEEHTSELQSLRPEYVFLAAGRVGGIH